VSSDRYLGMAEFGAYIGGKSGRTARRIVASGEVPFYRVRGTLLVKLSEVETWLEAHRVEVVEKRSDLKSLVDRAVQRARERRAS
jgi:excisionase family DNA binding protein